MRRCCRRLEEMQREVYGPPPPPDLEAERPQTPAADFDVPLVEADPSGGTGGPVLP